MTFTIEDGLNLTEREDPKASGETNADEGSMVNMPTGDSESILGNDEVGLGNNLSEYHDTIRNVLEGFRSPDVEGTYELSSGMDVMTVRALGYGQTPEGLGSTFPAHIAHGTSGEEDRVHLVVNIKKPSEALPAGEIFKDTTTIVLGIPLVHSQEFEGYPSGEASSLPEIDPSEVSFLSAYEEKYTGTQDEDGRQENSRVYIDEPNLVMGQISDFFEL